MKTLLILRHAKSSWKDDSLPDEERPLKKRGRRQATAMGELLAREGLLPDGVICSTAERTRQTLQLVAEAAGYTGEVHYTPQLYYTDLVTYLTVLRGLPNRYDRVLLVGHNPEVEELVAHLVGDTYPMPPATLAWLELPITAWSELNPATRGRLVERWTPPDEAE